MTDSDEARPNAELIGQLRAEFRPANMASKERVSQRLAASIGASVLRGAPTGSAAGSSAAGFARLAFAARGPALGLSFLLGAASGVGAYATLRQPQAPTILYRDRPVTGAPVVPSATASTMLAPASAPPSPAWPIVAVVPSSSVGRGLTAGLGEQQALLDVARRAFASEDYNSTLQALRAHFQRFPKSMLAEERDALEIKALAASGHAGHAKQLAQRFEAIYPNSLLLPSVKNSVQQIR